MASKQKKRGLRPLSDERFKLFVKLLQRTFHVPVKERTAEEKKGLVHFWRIRKYLTLKVVGNEVVILHRGKRVITKSDFRKKVLKETKRNLGTGARCMHHKLKSVVSGSSERKIRKILQKNKTHSMANAKFTNKPPLRSIESTEIFERLQIDLIDMRREEVSYQGATYRYILTVVDCFSRYTFLRSITRKNPKNIVSALESIFHEHGIPKIIQCDNGTEFKGILPSFLDKNGVRLIHSSPYHPQSQGKVERNNANIKKKIKFCYSRNPRGVSWVKYLGKIGYALNTEPKEVLGYLTPFAVYYGRGGKSADEMRKRAAICSSRCAKNMKRKGNEKTCSVYKPKEKILLKYPFTPQRVPRKRSILLGKILKRHKSYCKYFVCFKDPQGVRRKSWVSVQYLTSLTHEQEKIRREESRRIFEEKRRREEHRQKYYIPLCSSDGEENTSSRYESEEREEYAEESEREYTEGKGSYEIETGTGYGEFIPGVQLMMDPIKYGNCQFDAVSHQLSSLGIYRTGEQLRQTAVRHLRQNKSFYSDFFGEEQTFKNYILNMAKSTTYGDHYTLQAIAREYYLQILVVSKLGHGNHRIVSSTGIFDNDIPIITLGHYPEGYGEHYVSVHISDGFHNFLPLTLNNTDTAECIERVHVDPEEGACRNGTVSVTLPSVTSPVVMSRAKFLEPVHSEASLLSVNCATTQDSGPSETQPFFVPDELSQDDVPSVTPPFTVIHATSQDSVSPETPPAPVSPARSQTRLPPATPLADVPLAKPVPVPPQTPPTAVSPATTTSPLPPSTSSITQNSRPPQAAVFFAKSKDAFSPTVSSLMSQLTAPVNGNVHPITPQAHMIPSTAPDSAPSPIPPNQGMSNIPVLPSLVIEKIIRHSVELYPESLFRLQFVCRFFLSVIRKIGYPRVYINNKVMPCVPSPVSVRRIANKFGTHSGVMIRLRELIQDKRFINTWLEVQQLELGWFEVRNIFWRAKTR